jgi:non-canonical poly(A) RNA polymerase PAPD5/7
LRKNNDQFNSVTFIPAAKVPIIKLVENDTMINIDISFDRIDGIAIRDLILFFTKLYPAMKYIVFLIKHILRSRGLNETIKNGISSFALTLLVISYFQHISKEFDEDLYLSQHLLNFLKLYGEDFNYRRTGISIRDGGKYFPRKDYDSQSLNSLLDQAPLLYLENPQDPEINLGKNIKKMGDIVELFQN